MITSLFSIVLLVSALPTGLVTDNPHVFPSDPWYGIKTWFEDFQLNFIFDNNQKISTTVKQANEKIGEVLTMVAQNKTRLADTSASGFYSKMLYAYSLAKDQQTKQWISNNITYDINMLKNQTQVYSIQLVNVQAQMLNGGQGSITDSNHVQSALLGTQINYLNTLSNQIQMKDYSISGIQRF